MPSPLTTSEIVKKIRTSYEHYLTKHIINRENLFFEKLNKPTILVNIINEKMVGNLNYYNTDNYDKISVSSVEQVVEIIKELGLYKERTEEILYNQYNAIKGDVDNLCLKVSYFILVNF